MKENQRQIIIQGWSGMLFLLIMMFITDFAEYGMRGDFSALIGDPGMTGLWVLAVMACVNVLVSLFLHILDGRIWRWAVFGLTAAYTAFFVIHQLEHLLGGKGVDIHFFFDITHHTLGIIASIAAFKWAKFDIVDTAVSPRELG